MMEHTVWDLAAWDNGLVHWMREERRTACGKPGFDNGRTFKDWLGQDVCGLCLRYALTPHLPPDLVESLAQFVRGDLVPARTREEEEGSQG